MKRMRAKEKLMEWLDGDEHYRSRNPLFSSDRNNRCRKTIRTIIEKYFAALDLVRSQAEDETLWFIPDHMPEAYLQQELRRLHEAIEGKS